MKSKLKQLLTITFGVLFLFACNTKSKKNTTTYAVNKDVDISVFLTKNNEFDIKTVDCTLSNGDAAKCYEITTKGLIPDDHKVGPWCIDNLEDNADKGGIWFKDGEVYNVDGKFIKNLPELYHDDHWQLFDENGNVNKTLTKEDCIALKSAQLVDKFENFCIECLPEYVDDIKKTYLIPISPVKLETPFSLNPGPKPGEKKGEKPKGPPPGGKKGPIVLVKKKDLLLEVLLLMEWLLMLLLLYTLYWLVIAFHR